MKLRWSSSVADDIEALMARIRRDNPNAATRTGDKLYKRIRTLKQFPFSGRIGRADSTRELAVPGSPYVVVYSVDETRGVVEILRVVHGARNWPLEN